MCIKFSQFKSNKHCQTSGRTELNRTSMINDFFYSFGTFDTTECNVLYRFEHMVLKVLSSTSYKKLYYIYILFLFALRGWPVLDDTKVCSCINQTSVVCIQRFSYYLKNPSPLLSCAWYTPTLSHTCGQQTTIMLWLKVVWWGAWCP